MTEIRGLMTAEIVGDVTPNGKSTLAGAWLGGRSFSVAKPTMCSLIVVGFNCWADIRGVFDSNAA